MKYGIITHYNVLNHGAVLQMEALIMVLREFGIEAKALQYERNYDFINGHLKKKYIIGFGSFRYYLSFILKRGFSNFLFLFKKKHLLDKYKKEKRLIGSHYKSSERLDGIIVGSDEVFALDVGKTPALFGYGLNAGKVFAYAGSFGETTIDDINKKSCRAFIASGLRNMTGLSVRDNNSENVVANLLGVKPDIVCDPVILYGFTNELSMMERPTDKNYMVVYSYDMNMNDSEEIADIRMFASKRGLMIVSPSFFHRWVDKNVNVTPMELLEWFKYAEYVVTDTFHGCVMSLITNRDFVVRVRNNGNKIHSLMNLFGLNNCVVETNSLRTVIGNRMDWVYINGLISDYREKSMDYLKRMIAS